MLGQVSFSLHRLLEEPCIQLAASLVDPAQRPVRAMLHLQVWYSGPGQMNILQGEIEEDQQALIDIERNIANLERSLSASQLERGDASLLGGQVRCMN